MSRIILRQISEASSRLTLSTMKVAFRKVVLPREKARLIVFDHKVFPQPDWFDPDDWDSLESYWMLANGRKVGCCAFGRDADLENNPEDASQRRRGSLYIASTGILPSHQRRGLGERFKLWQIAWARRHGFTRIVTNSRRSNRHMIHVNEKYGFKILRTTRWNYYQRPAEPAVVMELRLPSRSSQGVILSAPMQTEQIVVLLIAERDRLSRAIEALQGPARRIGRPAGSAKRKVGAAKAAASTPAAPKAVKRTISAAGRKAIAEAAKRRWAAVRASKAAAPKA
jgi:GNAT superfamily N-acetyltransferase